MASSSTLSYTPAMRVSLNGIAHIQLTVNDPERCLPFWE
jgi:hypothetical protein